MFSICFSGNTGSCRVLGTHFQYYCFCCLLCVLTVGRCFSAISWYVTQKTAEAAVLVLKTNLIFAIILK